ncbi:MAG: hypothetical protein BWX50_00876 [Euryarchaeota archaeon ADurb.Bin009]|nr:MAG: hypothetical protein BWX50_00876 [Euryarchaeota archaeon ADurb.Bin009]
MHREFVALRRHRDEREIERFCGAVNPHSRIRLPRPYREGHRKVRRRLAPVAGDGRRIDTARRKGVVEEHPRSRPLLPVDERPAGQVVEREAVAGYDPLLPLCHAEEGEVRPGHVAFQVVGVVGAVGSKQVHRGRVALLLLQGDHPAHAPEVRGVDIDAARPDQVGQVVEGRVVAAGDEHRLLRLCARDGEPDVHGLSRLGALHIFRDPEVAVRPHRAHLDTRAP